MTELTVHGRKIALSLFATDNERVSGESTRETAKKPLFTIKDDDDSKWLHSELFPHCHFDRKLLLKGFTNRPDSESELRQLESASRTPAFHRFPWFYDGILSTTDGQPILLMELIDGRPLHSHFEYIIENGYDVRFALLQYCTVIRLLFDSVCQLHDLSGKAVYHCDIKPDNVLFKNNLLKVIDFNGATEEKYADTFGTARYLPAYALYDRGMRTLPLAFADLQLTTICALEVLVAAFAKFIDIPAEIILAVNDKELCQADFDEKRRRGKPISILARNQQFIEADKKLRKGLIDWTEARSDNIFVQLLSWVKEIPGPTVRVHKSQYDEWRGFLEMVSAEKLYDSAAELLVPEHLNQSEKANEVTFFCRQLASLMTTTTGTVFQSFYPLIYLAYSERTQWYDRPAQAAAEYAIRHLRHQKGHQQHFRCLDVGSGFGTGAFQAAEAGFEELYCWDNSPVFRRLADLLWTTTNNTKWKAEVKKLVDQHAELVAHTLEATGDPQGTLIELIERKRDSLSTHAIKMKQFVLADYWSLSRGTPELDVPDQFDYVICNNFLHWPVKDFASTKGTIRTSLADLDVASKDLKLLLYPLLKVLKHPGVLAIVEPTCFLEADGDDSAFNERYTEQSDFKQIMNIAYNKFLPEYFNVNVSLPTERPVVFRYDDIERTIETDFHECDVALENHSFSLPENCGWELVVMASFPMIVATGMSTEKQIRIVGGTKKGDFFSAFRQLISQIVGGKDAAILKETFNVVYIRKGIKDRPQA